VTLDPAKRTSRAAERYEEEGTFPEKYKFLRKEKILGQKIMGWETHTRCEHTADGGGKKEGDVTEEGLPQRGKAIQRGGKRNRCRYGPSW